MFEAGLWREEAQIRARWAGICIMTWASLEHWRAGIWSDLPTRIALIAAAVYVVAVVIHYAMLLTINLGELFAGLWARLASSRFR